MDRLGFIHDELDIKILILFILRRLTGFVDPNVLLELCQCDGGVGYFDYSDCLADLVKLGHVEEGEDGYRITEKGSRNAEAVESSLPYSVRSKAMKLIEPVELNQRRMAMIKTTHEVGELGCIVSLAVSDGQGNILDMKLLCADEEQAKRMERNFRRGAEGYYQRIIAMLDEEAKQ